MEYTSLEDIAYKYSKEDELLLTTENKEYILQNLKKIYMQRVSEIISSEKDKNSELFYWVNNCVSFNIVKVSSSLMEEPYNYIYIAPNIIDDIIFHDITEETSLQHIKMKTIKSSNQEFLRILVNMDVISNLKECFPNTFRDLYSNDYLYINSWIDDEYTGVATELVKPLMENVEFNQIRIHSDKYQFEKITSNINNSQLTFELSECLFAYDNQKWFICAAGIGAIIEHLMYLTLQNYNELKLLKSKTPTSFHYINAFRDSKNIEFDMKKENYIKSLFQIRNSISHYYDGFTAKDQCDILLSGIKNIAFNDCIPSLAFQESV